MPLRDLLVFDLSRVLAGPFASMLLADFGARVVKVEQPGGGDDTRHFGPPFVGDQACYYLSINRNKQSVAIDLKHPDGAALARSLAGRADVLIENFRPGVADKLGLGWAELQAANPRLIYCSVSGFGQAGLPAWSARPGYDLVIQGMSGLPSITGDAAGPPSKFGTSIADLVGGLYAVIGILVALHARERSGAGQWVDVSLLDGQISLLSYHAQSWFAGAEARRHGNAHPNITPYQTYRARDGWLNIACGNQAMWERFAGAVLGRPDLIADPRYRSIADRVAHRAELAALLEPLVAARDVADWLADLDRAGVPCGPILSIGEALAHPQVRARDMVVEVDHPSLGKLPTLGVPVKLSATPGAVRTPPPRLGEHTAAVLAELCGLGADEVARLMAAGAVAGLV